MVGRENTPEDVTKIKMLGESKEKERCGQYRELMAAFDRAEAFGDASFNPALIELEHMLDTSTVKPQTYVITTSRTTVLPVVNEPKKI